MHVAFASRPGGPGTVNLDWAGAAGGVAVVLDGLTEATETGCRHGTAWYVHQLGCRLLAEAGGADRTLADALADALAWVAGAHAGSCDLRHPGAPAATVAAVRRRGGTDAADAVVDYLVLSDAVVVLDAGDGPTAEPVVVTDRRVEEHLADLIGAANASGGAAGTAERNEEAALRALIEAQQRLRNRPEGYWVAQSDPAAAGEALTGELAGVRAALLLTDGAALLATLFGATSWRELVDLGLTGGPDVIIAATRELEARDPDRSIWPRYKTHDDATAVVCDLR